MSDSKVAAAIASGKVPEGITEAFLNESKDQPAIVAIVIVAVLTSCVVICRLVSRAFVVKRVGVDDGLALGSLVLFSSERVVARPSLLIKLFNRLASSHLSLFAFI